MNDESQQQSPLTEADPHSIQALFNKEPKELTDSEITAMVVELRRQRGVWAQAEGVKIAKGKTEKGIKLDKGTLDDLLKDL